MEIEETKEQRFPASSEGRGLFHPGMMRTLAEDMERRKKNKPWIQPGGKKLQRKDFEASTFSIYLFMLLHEKLNLEEKHV